MNVGALLERALSKANAIIFGTSFATSTYYSQHHHATYSLTQCQKSNGTLIVFQLCTGFIKRRRKRAKTRHHLLQVPPTNPTLLSSVTSKQDLDRRLLLTAKKENVKLSAISQSHTRRVRDWVYTLANAGTSSR